MGSAIFWKVKIITFAKDLIGVLFGLQHIKMHNVIEIFKTNIERKSQAEEVFNTLKNILPDARINFDLDDRDKILRVENVTIDPGVIIVAVEKLGFLCKMIPDKVCMDNSNSPEDMNEFWEAGFTAHKTMWGFSPANSAIIAKDVFVENGISDILIPGIGYGRNAQVFVENDIKVTGIEISKTAIELAGTHYHHDIKIFHGSVTDMPFDDHLYEGIFCYGLVYLLNPEQRKKMIRDSYNQLKPGGWMIFSVVSKNSPNYGKGKEVAKDTFEVGKGGQVFFYDMNTVKQDFEQYGFIESFEIDEQTNPVTNKPSFRFIVVKCKKEH